MSKKPADLELRKITAVAACTAEAVKAWEAAHLSILIYRAWRYGHRPQVLPKPQPDERDEIAEFKRIMDETES